MKALTAEAAGEVINALAQGYGVQEVAAAFGVSRQTISAIKHGRAWGHLPRPPQLPQPCRKPVEARRCIVCSAGIDAERIRLSIARVYRPVVARVIEPPCGPVDGLLSPLGLRVNHLLSVEQGPVG